MSLEIILNKKSLIGSSKISYPILGVLSIRFFFKKCAILFIIKKLINPSNKTDFSQLREHRSTKY